MTASKVQPRPNSILSPAVAPRSNATCRQTTKRCLFGKPDPADTKRLYDESVEQGRQRFIKNYGFDIATEQSVRNSSISSHSSSSSSSSSFLRKSPTREMYNGRPNEATNNKRVLPR